MTQSLSKPPTVWTEQDKTTKVIERNHEAADVWLVANYFYTQLLDMKKKGTFWTLSVAIKNFMVFFIIYL